MPPSESARRSSAIREHLFRGFNRECSPIRLVPASLLENPGRPQEERKSHDAIVAKLRSSLRNALGTSKHRDLEDSIPIASGSPGAQLRFNGGIRQPRSADSVRIDDIGLSADDLENLGPTNRASNFFKLPGLGGCFKNMTTTRPGVRLASSGKGFCSTKTFQSFAERTKKSVASRSALFALPSKRLSKSFAPWLSAPKMRLPD